jgi:tetratricopeptide (TPR) repeat protein
MDPERAIDRLDRSRRSLLRRELVILLVLTAAGTGAFFATRAVAAANLRQRGADALIWRERGRDALGRGDVVAAVEDLRRARRMDRADRASATLLATTLSRAGDADEAADILQSLRDARPDDAAVNTELARLEQRRGRQDLAIRYYQDALDALWAPAQRDAARAIRSEFIELLLGTGERSRALSQALVLASDLPPDPVWQTRVGRFFLEAGDPRRALDRFAAALATDPARVDALTGAGEAAFELGDYQKARQYLAAVRMPDARITDLKRIADLVVTGDPLAVRLTTAERQRRIAAIAAGADARLDACPSPPQEDPAARQQLREQLDEVAAAGDRRKVTVTIEQDRAEQSIELALRAHTLTAACAQPDVDGRAVAAIARLHGLDDAR